MDVKQANEHLLHGRLDVPGLFPHLEDLAAAPFVFEVDFGLPELPTEAGLILVRGPRQYGKSTWLESQVRSTIERFGPGTAFRLNGDEITAADSLVEAVRDVRALYRPDATVRRLFLDEVTAIAKWEQGLKRLIDAGELRGVLVVTTGSRATDLRRGTERLPGRKGRLERTTYVFTPLPYSEFKKVCGEELGADALTAYLLSGGCPLAAAEIAAHGRLPEFVIEMVRDWVLGECAMSGRNRGSLLAVWDVVLRRGGTPIGQAAVAREAGLANNTVAAGYLEQLADLMCLGAAHAWDADRRVAVRRRPAKFPPINLLAAVAFDRARLRSVADFQALQPGVQGRWFEWLVAQEIFRRNARRGEPSPEILHFWSAGRHEIDFVVDPTLMIEVKRGGLDASEFAWFPRVHPQGRLLVVGRESFEADRIRGLTMEELLLGEWQEGR
ncbi:MAG: AAA family ATPase [Candidatus Eisenbacteria bacterium]|nr:AAA family ATPase [Candidatus Eisenbacteria bacterium]